MRGKFTTIAILMLVLILAFGAVANAQAIRNVFGWVIADRLTGNLALGQYDSVLLFSDGTNWVQLATANN